MASPEQDPNPQGPTRPEHHCCAPQGCHLQIGAGVHGQLRVVGGGVVHVRPDEHGAEPTAPDARPHVAQGLRFVASRTASATTAAATAGTSATAAASAARLFVERCSMSLSAKTGIYKQCVFKKVNYK